MAHGLDAHITRFADRLAGADHAGRRRAAIGRWAAMVGAVVLARSIDDTTLANELLTETRAWLAGERPASAADAEKTGEDIGA